MTTNFSASLSNWVHEVEGSAEAVFKASVDDVLADAQKNTPVDTGYLRASLLVALNSEPGEIEPWRKKKKGDKYTGRAENAYEVEVSAADIGDLISARWTAEYASHVEYGHRQYAIVQGYGRQQVGSVAGTGFVRKAAQKWSQIVKANEAKLGKRLGR